MTDPERHRMMPLRNYLAKQRQMCYNDDMQYCLSDPHGCYDLFCRLLEKIRFDGGDTLYVLGDFIDKGPDSVRLARLLFSMPNVTCIAGNHEYDFLKYYDGLMRQTQDYDGVLQKLRAYFRDGALLDWETVDQMESLPYFVQGAQWIGVHAGLPVRADNLIVPPEDAVPEQLVYDRRFKDADLLPACGKCILYGHTPVRYLTGKDAILFYPRKGVAPGSRRIGDYHKIHLDMMTSLSGVMGCVCLDTCECFYVSVKKS